jgi:tripartite-type tricarboxylate transporter receptor subunit TctC
MRRNNKRPAVLAISLLIFATFRTSSFTAEKTPFYQGKTLNFVINFAAGGPTDIESRIFAKHLSRHIPGQPTITVQNMGGGGGLIAVNYIGEVSKPDGFTAAYFTGALFQQQIKDPALRSISASSVSSRACTVSPCHTFAPKCRRASRSLRTSSRRKSFVPPVLE